MQRKFESIMHYTAEELRAKIARGESQTDWKSAAAMPLPDGSDPDDAMEDVDWSLENVPMPRPKTHASLRIDADVLDWFKAQGRGCQTKINAVLRSYVTQKRG